jgi:hypothetical protein
LASKALRIGRASSSDHNVTGLLLAALTYDATWLPPRYFVYIPAVAAAASFVLVAAIYRPGFLRAPVLWLIQLCIVIAIESLALMALEGPRPITEITALSKFLSSGILFKGAGVHLIHAPRLPGDFAIEWNTTGSSWLDQKAGPVAFEITPSPNSPPLVVDFQEGGKTIFYKDVVSVPFRFAQTIATGQSYHLVISWRNLDLKEAPLDGAILVYSVLSPRIIAQPNPT